MKITAKRDHYFWQIIVEEWQTKIECSFSDLDPYELIEVAQTIIYQTDIKDWNDATEKIISYLNR